MKIAIMQPYFLPYIGYFQLINSVEYFIIYDDVNYIKKGWINRNNLLVNGEKTMFTMSLLAASQNKKINEIYIGDDFIKLRKNVIASYSKAPYFNETMLLFDKIISYPNKHLSSFIGNSIIEISKYLNLNTKFEFSSNIEKDQNLKGQDKIIEICQKLKATNYINASNGQSLYDKPSFERNGIKLNFIEPKIEPYTQFNNEFVPYLSILDILMFNSKVDIEKLLNSYSII